MLQMIRKLLCGAALAPLLAFSSPAEAQFFGGGVVYCTNCSQEVNDVIRWAQSLANQVREIEQQIQAVQWLITNTVSLPQRLINDITSPIYQIQGMVRQAEMLGQQTTFMISNLGAMRGYGGWGGSLNDISFALQQENYALSNAMQQLGLVSRQVSGVISTQCAQQYASIDGVDPGGIKAATMAGTTMAATAGQCAEARAQMQAAYQNAMATAQLRAADRQAMFDAADQRDLQANIQAACSAMTNRSSWLCAQSPSSPSAGTPSSYSTPAQPNLPASDTLLNAPPTS